MFNIKTIKQIDSSDWDNAIRLIYNKPYCFQQQYGCQERGTRSIYPVYDTHDIDYIDDFDSIHIPLEINGNTRGVSLKTWLETNPQDHLDRRKHWSSHDLELFWERSFYPSIEALANDLCKKGYLEEGVYQIKIDW